MTIGALTKKFLWDRENLSSFENLFTKWLQNTRLLSVSIRAQVRFLCFKFLLLFSLFLLARSLRFVQDKAQNLFQVPEETCDLTPQKECKHVTKLVPNLKPTEECVDVPKEVCHKTKTNPRKVAKPVLKRWCYTPSKESGLFRWSPKGWRQKLDWRLSLQRKMLRFAILNGLV